MNRLTEEELQVARAIPMILAVENHYDDAAEVARKLLTAYKEAAAEIERLAKVNEGLMQVLAYGATQHSAPLRCSSEAVLAEWMQASSEPTEDTEGGDAE